MFLRHGHPSALDRHDGGEAAHGNPSPGAATGVDKLQFHEHASFASYLRLPTTRRAQPLPNSSQVVSLVKNSSRSALNRISTSVTVCALMAERVIGPTSPSSAKIGRAHV